MIVPTLGAATARSGPVAELPALTVKSDPDEGGVTRPHEQLPPPLFAGPLEVLRGIGLGPRRGQVGPKTRSAEGGGAGGGLPGRGRGQSGVSVCFILPPRSPKPPHPQSRFHGAIVAAAA
jgi:hypothetical protein